MTRRGSSLSWPGAERGPATIDARRELFQAHRGKVSRKIGELEESLKHIDRKLAIYSSPKAEEIILNQIRYVNEEKTGCGLISQFAGIDLNGADSLPDDAVSDHTLD